MSLKLKLTCFFLALNRKKGRKKQPWIGKQFRVKRLEHKDIEVFLFEPKTRKYEKLPVIFNVHGGAWVGGDATLLDTQSQELADILSAFVVNINYKKLDKEPFPYAATEVRDTVLYFAKNTNEYGLDVSKFNIIGYSAGGHICAGAAMLLRDVKFALCSQILCYPFLDFHTFDAGLGMGVDEKATKLMSELFFRNGMNSDMPIMSPCVASKEYLVRLAPVEFISCGPDDLYQQGLEYCKHLLDAGVDVVFKEFETATHGFMEVNYPEYKDTVNTEQVKYREESFAYLAGRMKKRWS